MTNAEMKKASEAVVKELTKAGIKAKAYAKSPVTPNNIFIVSLDNQNVVRVWAGEARVDVIPSGEKGLCQAVVQAYEKARVVTKEYKLSWNDWIDGVKTPEELQRSMTDWKIERNLGVALPQGTEFSITALNRLDHPSSPGAGSADDYGTATLQGKVKASRQNFLIGRDEKSQFISALPRQARSVKDAHDALRPAGVPRTALRQGEWFFVPATAQERKSIESVIKSRGSGGIYKNGSARLQINMRRNAVGELESYSSHHAPCLVEIGTKKYACGLVYDTRPDRHGSLMLSGWHRVIRNREVVNSTASQRGVARFD